MYKNPLHYPALSYVEKEKEKQKKHIDRKMKLLKEEQEILEEKQLLTRINRLPEDVQRYIGNFSPVIMKLKRQVKYEFFDAWVTQNVERIISILETWTKKHVGFILNRILQLKDPDTEMYIQGDHLYKHWSAGHMRCLIILEISNRCRKPFQDRYQLLPKYSYAYMHKYIPYSQNTSFDDISVIRVWAAYKAIEEYDARLKAKAKTKAKKSKTKK